jgi:hypothetical protein
MRSLFRLAALLAVVAMTLMSLGCGEKPPSPDDPNSKQNAMKHPPGASGGAPTGGAATDSTAAGKKD